jgi:hypothetical protein
MWRTHNNRRKSLIILIILIIFKLFNEVSWQKEKISTFYTEYCNNYSNVHERVVKLKKENQKFREFLEKTERVHSKGEDLETSLIRIVQRIPQYNMILNVWLYLIIT